MTTMLKASFINQMNGFGLGTGIDLVAKANAVRHLT